MLSERWDAIVIGAGHNGLVCAAYLAKAGMQVLVLERSHRIGGASITEELVPGCQFSTFAYNANGPGPKICRELEIPAAAIEVVSPNPTMFFPFPDGDHLLLWADEKKTLAELSRFGPREAEGYIAYQRLMQAGKQIAKDFFYQPPPTTQQLYDRYEGTEFAVALEAMLTRSHWEVLCDHFENDKVRVALARADDVGYPTTVGSLLAEVVESANDGVGVQGLAGIPRGGMGSITAALAAAGRRFGVEIRTESPIEQILVEHGSAVGVRLVGGEIVRAARVISNADPKRTFLKLLDRNELSSTFHAQVAQLKTLAGNMKYHAVLKGLPRFTALPDHLADDPRAIAGVRIAPQLEYFERAWRDCLAGIPSREPVLSLQLPTAYLPELAPPGKHLFGAWVRYGPQELQEGTWETWRPQVVESILSILETYAPGFRDLIEWQRLYTPADIQKETGITGASIRHLDMTLDQMLHQRPLPAWSAYQTPLEGLWLCGSGTHPCGSVTGAPGHNAAQAILQKR